MLQFVNDRCHSDASNAQARTFSFHFPDWGSDWDWIDLLNRHRGQQGDVFRLITVRSSSLSADVQQRDERRQRETEDGWVLLTEQAPWGHREKKRKRKTTISIQCFVFVFSPDSCEIN